MDGLIRKISSVKNVVAEKFENKFSEPKSEESDNSRRHDGLASLADDRDVFSGLGEAGHRYPFSQTLDSQSDCLSFQVLSGHKVVEGRSAYVVYNISVDRRRTHDKNSGILTKRYSDFKSLHVKLKKQFPSETHDIKIPNKKLAGNFTDATIAERSRAFEQYLTHVCSITQLRYSVYLDDFFYMDDIINGFELYRQENYKKAISTLETCLTVFEHVVSNAFDVNVVIVLCCLVDSYMKVRNLRLGLKYGDIALGYINKNENLYAVPLIQTMISICWQTGKEKRDLELKLEALSSPGDSSSAVPLQDLLMQEFL